MGAKQAKGGPLPTGSPRRRGLLTSRERGDFLTALVMRSGEKFGKGGGVGLPPPYYRRVGLIQDLLMLVKQGRQEEATDLLKHLRQVSVDRGPGRGRGQSERCPEVAPARPGGDGGGRGSRAAFRAPGWPPRRAPAFSGAPLSLPCDALGALALAGEAIGSGGAGSPPRLRAVSPRVSVASRQSPDKRQWAAGGGGGVGPGLPRSWRGSFSGPRIEAGARVSSHLLRALTPGSPPPFVSPCAVKRA